ncbi:MAG: hypothetical protein JWP92_197, partial [Caulobacter sp.]|nr:hypothetical protein [Caulobacter sp.]
MPETPPSDWRRFVGANLSRSALAAATARQTEIRHAIRVTAAVGAAYALATLLRLPQGYWAVFTAVIVVQTSIGATITASMERLLGTVVGGLAGAAGAYLQARFGLNEGLVLCGVVAILVFGATVRPRLKVAPITAVIVLIGATNHLDPLLSAALRVAEITVGSLVGVAATLLIFPARAHGAVIDRTQEVAGLIAELLDHYALKLRGGETELDARGHYDGTLAALAKLQTAMTEAERESASKLSVRSVSDALPRTLWRLRNDAAVVGRALREPLPTPGLNLQAAAMLVAAAGFLRQAAAHLDQGPRPDRVAFAEAHLAFQTAVETLRSSGVTRALAFDDAARV